jgi:hypothetical protein
VPPHFPSLANTRFERRPARSRVPVSSRIVQTFSSEPFLIRRSSVRIPCSAGGGRRTVDFVSNLNQCRRELAGGLASRCVPERMVMTSAPGSRRNGATADSNGATAVRPSDGDRVERYEGAGRHRQSDSPEPQALTPGRNHRRSTPVLRKPAAILTIVPSPGKRHRQGPRFKSLQSSPPTVLRW